RGQLHGPGPVLRQVADTDIGAALQLHVEVELARIPGVAIRDLDCEIVPVDFLLAEELVAVDLAARKPRRGKLHAVRAAFETETLTIEVIAVEELELDQQPLAVGRNGIRERDV